MYQLSLGHEDIPQPMPLQAQTKIDIIECYRKALVESAHGKKLALLDREACAGHGRHIAAYDRSRGLNIFWLNACEQMRRNTTWTGNQAGMLNATVITEHKWTSAADRRIGSCCGQ